MKSKETYQFGTSRMSIHSIRLVLQSFIWLCAPLHLMNRRFPECAAYQFESDRVFDAMQCFQFCAMWSDRLSIRNMVVVRHDTNSSLPC
jgi:hypothetical protein